MIRDFASREIKQSWNEIDLPNRAWNPGLFAVVHPWHVHQERYVRCLFIQRTLLEHAVVAGHFSVLACEDDDRIIGLSALFQRFENYAKLVVD